MNNLEKSLKLISKDTEILEKYIDFVKFFEQKFSYEGGSVRDDITKYLIDAVFEKEDTFEKANQEGIKYKFLVGVGSKIAREFLLSTPKIPQYIWEPQTTKLLLYLSKNAKNVVIGGAYFGDQALPISKVIEKNNGVVHAFDLNENQITMLKDNLLSNNAMNILPIQKGLWSDSTTFLNLTDTDDLAFATPAESTIANTISIDQYVIDRKIESVDLIMLDIEGSEYEVLKGAIDQLNKSSNYPNIVFEIHSSYIDWSKGLLNTPIFELLTSCGYTMYSIRDFQGNYDMVDKPIELINPEETVLEGPKHGFNVLAIKDKTLIANPLFKMVSNVSPKYILHKSPLLHHHTDGF
ncbi:MAG: FkbM family methyltransferase [Ferruginibacter sp.]|nr:FkbM family methyltransferase [Ferruginibacter sp.]